MYVVHIASELAPIAKAGGLGDVLYGLSKELSRLGHQVEILLPKYDCIDYSLLKELQVYYRELWSYEGPYRYNNTIWSAKVDGLSVLLLEPHHPKFFFSRGHIYGSHDDIDRFLYFSRACMEFLFKSGKKPDQIHVHDWPTSIIPALIKDMYQALGFPPTSTVLTLHNIEHQGHCSPTNLSQIGLRGEDYLAPHLFQDPVQHHLINLLKGGIEYATAVTTVSPSYEKEIKTRQEGKGLHTTLIKHQQKLHGILNGIDEDFWNPETDPYIIQPFSTHPPFTEEAMLAIKKGKEKNKKELRQRLNLKADKRPLIACISRLVPQKGPTLIAAAFRHIVKAGGQCVILGSTYSPDMQALFVHLQEEHSSHPHGALFLEYNEPLSHLIYAAADALLIPSLFEPCGLTQMIALRYGTLPIVRRTGGLSDTVSDHNGFVFEQPKVDEMIPVLDQALSLWKKSPALWQEKQKEGMSQDFSWKHAAKVYLALYESLKP